MLKNVYFVKIFYVCAYNLSFSTPTSSTKIILKSIFLIIALLTIILIISFFIKWISAPE